MIDYKNILVIGFTKRTSYHLSKYLLENNYNVYISDIENSNEKIELLKSLPNQNNIINLLGNQSENILNQYDIDLVCPSPGVPLNIPIINKAKEKNIPILGDIELFYQLFPKNCYLGITGTDGKTTTTTLVYEIIKREKNAILAGNIGIPIFSIYNQVNNDSIIVLELSSFQLETIEKFHPLVASILNIAEDHLDRYDNMESYVYAKKNIFKNQDKNDFSILNYDSPYFNVLSSTINSKILTFSRTNPNSDCYFENNTIYYNKQKYIDKSEVKLKGIHNIENIMAAILMCKSVGISDNTIKNVLREFSGVEHRIEFVRNINGIEFYNDSKATTVNALEKALMSFDNPIILIAGGRDKGLDFRKISDLANKKLKLLVLIGEASNKIKKELGFPNYYFASDMKDAVYYSFKNSKPNDVVLLSPGCASFDMYKNYEERGKDFKNIVLSLNGDNNG